MRCPIAGCGEPWSLDSIHEQIAEDYPNEPWRKPGDKPGYNRETQKRYEDGYFNKYVARFHREGCELFGCSHNIVYICGDCGAQNSEKTDCYMCESTNLSVLGEQTGTHGLAASEAQLALYEMMGDDVDGIEAMMADEGF